MMSEMEEREIERRFEAISQFEPDPEVTARDLEIARKSFIEQTTKSQTKQQGIWRIIMKTKTFKVAAAAVIIIAVSLGVHEFVGIPGSPSVAWADVVKSILNARTASLDIRVGSQGGIVIHDDIKGSRIRRSVSNMEKAVDIVIDLEQQKLLTIDHDKKMATYVGLEGLGNIPNYVEHLQNLIKKLQDHPDVQVENQGIQEVDGQEYFVFVASAGNDTITIWADPDTALPVRIEHKTPNMVISCDNMKFNVTFEDSLFSMEVPAGYKTEDAGAINFQEGNESDFIESLRIWAEIIEGGQFPDSINLEDIVDIGPKIEKAFEQAGLTDEEQTQLGLKWGQGLVFLRFFRGQGQWHYAGQGVKLGDGEKPIFWYQPKDSETWRVIYGDLRVEDVAEGNLPK
jgi:hypothetical protein